MLDTAREDCFLVGTIVCIKRKVFLGKHQYINTLYTCLFCSELERSEPVGCWHSPKNDLRKHWMSERGQIHELQNMKKKQIWLFLHFQISISFINHQSPEHREVHLTTLKRSMYRIYKFMIYPRLNPCPWRNQSEPCPCCVGAPTATVCCPGEKLRTAPVKRLESGCCWTESFLEVHQQGWVLQRRQRGWVFKLKQKKKKKQQVCISTHPYMS